MWETRYSSAYVVTIPPSKKKGKEHPTAMDGPTSDGISSHPLPSGHTSRRLRGRTKHAATTVTIEPRMAGAISPTYFTNTNQSGPIGYGHPFFQRLTKPNSQPITPGQVFFLRRLIIWVIWPYSLGPFPSSALKSCSILSQ